MMLGKYSHSNPPKKEQRASRVRLDWCNRVPTLQDIRLLASEAFNTKGLLVELPIRTPAGVFLLSCQRDNLSPAPCWTLYEGEDGAKQLWSYLDENVDMISDITGMSVMPKDAKTHVDLPKPDLASLINQEAAAAATASPAAAPAAAPAPVPAAAPMPAAQMPAAPMPAAPLPPPAPFADPTAWAPQNTASGTPWGATPAADWAAMSQQPAPQQDWTQAPQPAAQPGWNQAPQAAPGWPQQAAPAANQWPAQAPPGQPGWNQAPPAQPEASPWNQQPPTQPAGWPQQPMPQQAPAQGAWPAQAAPAQQQASPWGAAAAAPAPQQVNPWNSAPAAPAAPASTGNAAADFVASLNNRENVTIAELSMDPMLPGNCVDAVLKLQEMVLTGHFTDRVAVAAIKLVAQNNGVLDESIIQKAKASAGTDPTELARQGGQVLVQAGLLTEQDLFKAESCMGTVKNNFADALLSSCSGKIDKLILEAAQDCHLMVTQGRLRIDQAMIALHYCTRSRVRLKDALEELNIEVV